MRKIINKGLFLFIGFLFFSCDKYEMVRYEAGDRLNFIGYNQWGQLKDDESLLVWNGNFGINPQGDSLKMDTVKVGIRISGEAVNFPRKFTLKVKNRAEETAEIMLRNDYAIPADTGIVEVEIYVKRPAKRNVDYDAALEFDYEHSDFTPGTLERQAFVLKYQDRVTTELWEVNEVYFNYFLGDWSETKARFIITVTGALSFSTWMASSKFQSDYYRVIEAFEAYKTDPSNPPLLDDNGQWISFPKLF